jgi:hypothetical protein
MDSRNTEATVLQQTGDFLNSVANVQNSFLTNDSAPLRDAKPEKLVYAREFDWRYIPGESELVKKQFPKGPAGIPVNSAQDIVTYDLVNRRATIDGSKSFFVATCKAIKADGTPVVDADNISLAPEANNILFERIDLKANGETLHTNVRQDVLRHLMRRLTTSNGDRASRCYLNELMGTDAEIGVNTTPSYSQLIHRNPITDGKEFQLVRYLDDLPFFGQLDADIPGKTNLVFTIKYCSDASRLFRTDAETESPQFFITMLELYIHQNYLTESAGLEIERAITNPSIPFYFTTDKWEFAYLPEGNIQPGTTMFSSNISRIMLSTPDVAFVCLLPANTFNAVGNSNQIGSIFKKSWGNVREFILRRDGRVLRNYIDLDTVSKRGLVYKSVVNTLSGPQDAMPMRGFSPFDYVEFMNGGMSVFPLDLRYISSKNVQEPQIIALDIQFIFGAGGCSELMVPVIVTKSKGLYEYMPDGSIKTYR